MAGNTQSFSDYAPTSGELTIYKVPEKDFDKKAVHFQDEFLIVRKHMRVNASSHGITRVINAANRVKKRKNLVLDLGREIIADIMAGRIPADPIINLVIGTGGYIGEPDINTNPPSPQGTDTHLNNEIFEKAIDSIEKPNRAANTYIGFIDADELNGQLLTEWGLKTLSGFLFSRATTKPVPKEQGFIYVVRWTIQH